MTDVFKTGNFIKFSNIEDGKKYHIIGKVLDFDKNKDEVFMFCEQPYGEMSIFLGKGDEDKFKKITKPSTWRVSHDKEAEEIRLKLEKRMKKEVIQPAIGQSKKELAVTLYKQYIEEKKRSPSRKNTIKLLVDKLGMTEATASTYAAMCKKEIKKEVEDGLFSF